MGNIAKICSIKKTASGNEKSLANSLAARSLNRMPGAFLKIVPFKEADGRYRTGLDENAAYLKKLPKEEQEKEKARIIETRERLEKATNLKLGPWDSFYTNIYDPNFYGSRRVAQPIKLMDGENVFNFEDTFEEITFHWLSVHPAIAPSYEAFKRGEVASDCQYYVSNPEVENNIKFDENKVINRAVVLMDEMSPDQRKRISRLLGLPVSDNDTEQQVYNILNDFIKQGEITVGDYRGHNAVRLFMDIINLKEDTLAVKDLIAQALAYGIYRKQAGEFFEGNQSVAENESALIKFLSSAKGQETYLALEKRIRDKKITA